MLSNYLLGGWSPVDSMIHCCVKLRKSKSVSVQVEIIEHKLESNTSVYTKHLIQQQSHSAWLRLYNGVEIRGSTNCAQNHIKKKNRFWYFENVIKNIKCYNFHRYSRISTNSLSWKRPQRSPNSNPTTIGRGATH